MKQTKLLQGDSPTDSREECRESRNNRFKKKREDRKRKLAGGKVEIKDSPDISSSEERKQNRKMRNRDAAQRARDKAKMKLQELHDEVEMLRMENEILKKKMVIICLKCQNEVVVKEEDQSSPSTSNIVSESPSKMELQQKSECKLERVTTMPVFQYPFLFGVLTIIACLILILACPCDDEQNMQLRILQSILEKNWRENSLTRQIHLGNHEQLMDPGQSRFGLKGRGYEYYKHLVYLRPRDERGSSLVIEIQQEESSEQSEQSSLSGLQQYIQT